MRPPPKRPCGSCPWRRKSLPGYLGAHTAEEFLGRAMSDQPMECHSTIDYEDPDRTHLDQIADGEAHHCAGAAIFFANICKLSRDHDRPRMEADREEVFAMPAEFTEHHDTPRHREFVAVIRREEGDDGAA